MHDQRNANRAGAPSNGAADLRSPTKPVTEPAQEQAAGRPEPKMSSAVRKLLGDRLRSAYAGLVNEPVPERFVKLLEKLEATEKPS